MVAAIAVLMFVVAAQFALIAWLIHSPDLTEMVALTDRLCQRLQAPMVAVGEHDAQVAGLFAPPAVPMDDDDAHWESKDDLARRLDVMAGG
jgi:hypothetical protein